MHLKLQMARLQIFKESLKPSASNCPQNLLNYMKHAQSSLNISQSLMTAEIHHHREETQGGLTGIITTMQTGNNSTTHQLTMPATDVEIPTT